MSGCIEIVRELFAIQSDEERLVAMEVRWARFNERVGIYVRSSRDSAGGWSETEFGLTICYVRFDRSEWARLVELAAVLWTQWDRRWGPGGEFA